MKRVVFSFLLTFLILSSIGLAQDFSIDVDVKDFYVATHTDYITLKINNPMSEDWFSISLIGPEDWVKAEAFSLRVPTAGSETTLIKVEPPKDVVPLLYPYQYFLKIKRISTGSVLEEKILLKIKQITNAIIKDFKLSCTSCMDKVDISGTVYNVGSNPIDLSIVFNLGGQTKTLHIGFVNVFGKEEFETSFSLKNWKPGDYNVEAKLIDVEGRLMYEESGSFKIPFIENIIYDRDVSSTIFGATVTVTATNEGNSASEADLKSVAPQTWYSIYSGPSPTGMAIGEHYYWKVQLEPNESKSITYSEVYWPTYVIILFIIAIIGLAYWQSKAFDFSKIIHGSRRAKAGKNISVSLHIKGKKNGVDRAVVKDVVPSGYSIVDKFETVKPIIRKIANGVELNWKVGKLKPQEERVLHYTIKPTAEAKTKKLPPARARALHKKKIVHRKSNKISLSPEKEEVKFVTVKVRK
ncbi:MAG: hypothetical protein GTN36_04350 [Candidatus Aenigmarchaeota archaeon]|nr:hypothetical protein [Candidatus Aenigmarchaeota archaeon]